MTFERPKLSDRASGVWFRQQGPGGRWFLVFTGSLALMFRRFIDQVSASRRLWGPRAERIQEQLRARLSRRVGRQFRVEALEERRVMAYGTTVPGVFVGDNASDYLRLEAGTGGNLRHNLPITDPYMVAAGVTVPNPAYAPLLALGLAYESEYDASGTIPGVQLFPNAAVSVTNSGGDDIIEMIGIGALSVVGSPLGNETLRILGSGGDDTFTVSPASVTFGVDVAAIADIDLIEIVGSGGADTVILAGSTTPVVFDGGAGDDVLEVTLVSPGGADFLGGTGSDELQIAPAVLGLVTTYSPGSSLEIDLQTFSFSQIEAIDDQAPTALLDVAADGADNAINYVGGLFNELTVDANETYSFLGKGALTLDAGPGDDVVNFAPSPIASALLAITVDGGGSPGDQLIVAGALPVAITVDVGASIITGVSTTPAAINYDGFSSLTVRRGFATGLSLTGSSTYEVNFGDQLDEGTIQTDELPIHFDDFDSTRQINLDGAVIAVNGSDGDDEIEVAANPGEVRVADRPVVVPQGYTSVVVDGRDGDDSVEVTTTDAGLIAALDLRGGSGFDTLDWNTSTAVAGAFDAKFEEILLQQNLTTTGDITLHGATVLDGNRVITTSGGDVTFEGSVDGAFSLNISTGGGDVRFLGNVGEVDRLTTITVASSGELLLAANLRTSGAVNFSAASGGVRLSDDVTLTTGGNISIGSAVNGTTSGAESLTIDAGTSAVTLAGVGTTQPLGTFRVAHAGTVNPGGNVVTAGSSTIDFGGATLVINVAGFTLDATGGGVNPEGADVILAAVVADVAANNRDLTILAGTTGRALLTGPIGATRIDGLSITAGGGTQVSGNITASNGGDPVIFRGPTTLLASVTIDSGNGSTDGPVVFAGSLDGSFDLTIDANTDSVTFEQAVGAQTRLGDAVGAALTITEADGDVNFRGPVDLASGLSSLDAETGLAFLDDVSILAGNTPTTILGDKVTLSGMIFATAGAATFGDAASDVWTLTSGDVTIRTASGGGTLTVNAAVQGAQDLTLDLGSGGATFAAPLGDVTALGDGVGAALTLAAGSVTFQNRVLTTSGVRAGEATNITFQQDVTIGAGDVGSSFGGSVTLDGLTLLSAGALEFGDASTDVLTLSGGAVSITTTGLGDTLTVAGRLDGAQDLTLNIFGATRFNGPVGSVVGIGDSAGAALTINSPGATTFESTLRTASGIVQAGGAGLLTFRDDVTLGDGDTNSTLNARVTLDGLTLSVQDPLTIGDTAADTLLVTGTTTIVSSNDLLRVISATTLAADLTIDSGTANLTFDGTVNGAAGLTLNSSGVTRINGAVGASSPVASLTTSAAGSTELNASLVAHGNSLTFNDPVTLISSLSLTDSGDVTFANTLNGAFDLTLTVGGTTRFVGAVGAGTPLGDGVGAALTINSTGATIFQGTLTTNSGIAQADLAGVLVLQSDVVIGAGNTDTTLLADVVLDGLKLSAARSITFGNSESDSLELSGAAVEVTTAAANASQTYNGRIDGPQDFAVNAGTNSIVFNGAIGASVPLGDSSGAALTILGADAGAIFFGPVRLASGIVSADQQTPVRFDENVTIDGADTSSSLFGPTITFNGMTFTSTGELVLGDSPADTISLGGAGVTIDLSSGAGSLAVLGNLQGNVDLSLDVGSGLATFAAPVGDVFPLGDGVGPALTLLAGTFVFEDTVDALNGIVAEGATRVTFEDDVTIGGGDTASRFSGDVTLRGLTLTSFGALTLGDEPLDQIALSDSDVTIVTGGLGSALSVLGRVDGDVNLILDAADWTRFAAPVGSLLPIGDGLAAAITINSSGATTFEQTLDTSSGVVQSGAAGVLTFAGDVRLGVGAVTTLLAGDVVLDGVVVTAEDAITIGDGADDTLTVLQNSWLIAESEAVTLGASTILSADFLVGSGLAPLTIDGDVDGPYGLILLSSLVTRINGDVGSIVPIRSLWTDVSGTTELNGSITAAGNTLTFNDSVELLSSVRITDTGNVTFNSSVDGPFDLTLAVGGTTRFNGPVGGLNPLGDGTGGAIVLQSTGETIFVDNVTTSSGIVQEAGAGQVTFQADLTLGLGDTPTTLAGDVVLDGLSIVSDGSIEFGDDETDRITLSGGAVSVQTLGQSQHYLGQVDGSQNLSVDAGDSSILFSAPVGGTQRVGAGSGAALEIVAALAGVEFRGAVRLASGLESLDEQTNVTFREDVDMLAGDTGTTINGSLVTLDGLAFRSAGSVVLGDSAADRVTLSGGAVTLDISSGSGALFVAANVQGSQDLTVSVGTGNATFAGRIGNVTPLGDGVGPALSLTAGTLTFDDTIQTLSGIVAGAATRVTFRQDVTIGAGDTASNLRGDVTLDGMSLASDGSVTLGDELTDQITLSSAAVALTTTGFENTLTIFARVDGAQDLTLTIGGATLLAAPVGEQTPIGDGAGAALIINSTDSTTFGTTLATRSGVVQANSAGLLTFQGDVTVGDGDTNTALNANVVFDGLTFAAEDPVVIGDATTDVLVVSAASLLRTSSDQVTVNSAVTLGADLTIDSAAGNLTLNGTVNGLAALVLNSSGTTTINGVIGGTTPISSLTTDAAGTTLLNANVSSQGNTQTYDDPVTLLSSVTITDVGNVTFNNTVDGAFDLTLNVDGTTRFNGPVGGIIPLGDGTGGAIVLQSTGETIFVDTVATSSGIVQTPGAGPVTFQGDLTLGAGDTPTTLAGDVVLDGLSIFSAGSIEFGDDETDRITLSSGPVSVQTLGQTQRYRGQVDGSQNLSVDAGDSSILFAASVGAAQRIGTGVGPALEIVTALAGVEFQGAVRLASGLESLDEQTNVLFRENVDLLAGDTGTTIFGAQIILDGMAFRSAGEVVFGNATSDRVTLSGGAVTLDTSAGSGSLFVAANVQGSQDLTVDVGTGGATFAGRVGDVAPLGDSSGPAISLLAGTVSFGDTVQTFSGIVAGSNTRVFFLQDVTLGAGDTGSHLRGDVTFDGMVLVSDGAVTLGDESTDQVTLSSSAVTLTTTAPGDNLTIFSRVDGAQDLTLNISGATHMSAPVGSQTALGDGVGAAIVINSSGTTTFAATLATRSGMLQANSAGLLTFEDNVTLGDGDTNTAFNANVVFDGLTFVAEDPVVIGNAGSDSLLVSATSLLRTSSDQVTVNSAVTLGGNLTIDSAAGNLTLNGTVNGQAALVLNSSATTTINGVIGGTTPIGSLTTDAAGTTLLNANVSAQGNSQTYNDPVTLLSSVTLTDTGDVTFASTLNGSFDLTMVVAGTSRFVGAVGTVSALGDGTGPAITINSLGTTVFESTLRTGSGVTQAENAGRVTFRGDVTLGAGNTDTTLNGDVTLDGLTITSAGRLNFGSDETDLITLSGGAVTVTTAAANVSQTYNGRIEGSQDLSVNAGTSSIVFQASLGASQAIGDGTGPALVIGGADLGVTFNGPVRLASGLTSLDQETRLTFEENVSILAGTQATVINGDVTLNGLSFNSAGNVTLGDAATDRVTLAVGASSINLAAGNATLLVNANVQGAQDLSIAVGTGLATFNAAIGNVTTLGDGIGAALTLDSGTIVFESTLRAASGIVAGDSTRVTFRQDVTITAGDTANRFAGDVTLDGLTFASDVALNLGDGANDQITLSSGPVTLTTSGLGDNLLVSGRVDGAQDLTLSIAGAAQFLAPVGSQAALGDGVGAALIINSTGATTFASTLNARSGMTQADAAGALTLQGNVTLGDGDTNTTLNAAVVLDGLTLSADDPITFGNATTDSLLVAATTLVRTSGDLATVNSATTLAGDLTIDTAAGNLVLNGTVNGAFGLVLMSSGTTTINGVVGAVTPIRSLTTDAPGTTQLNANITAQGNSMTYNDPVTLLSSLTLTDLGDVTFASTVNGSFDLTLNVLGATRFIGAVGAVSAIGDGAGPAIIINSLGTTTFESTLRTSSGITQAENAGTMTLRGDATLGAGNTDTTLNANAVLDGLTVTSAGRIVFGSDETDTVTLSGGPVTVTTAAANVAQVYQGKVNGSQDLTVTAGAGAITFNASIGETQRPGDGVGAALTIGVATGGVTFAGPVSLSSGLVSLDDTTGVTFRDDVDIAAGDTATTINANALRLNGLTFRSSGSVTLTDDATDVLTLDDALVTISTATGGGNVTVNGLVRSNDDAETTLIVDAGQGSVALKAAIGDLAANSLAALAITGRNIELRQIGAAAVEGVAGATSANAAVSINFSGTIYTANQQSYVAGQSFDLTSGAPTTFTSSNDAISFSTGVIALANGSDLTINSNDGAVTTGAIRGASSEDVTINSGAGTTTVGAIGLANEINTVAITGARINLAGNIVTSNAAGNTVTLLGAVELLAPVFINTNTAGVDGSVSILGPGTVDGAHDFRIDAGSASITIAGTIGAGVSTPLDSLELDAAVIDLASIGTPTEAGVIHTTDVNATTVLNFTGTNYHTNVARYAAPVGANLVVAAGAPTSFLTSDDALTFATAIVQLADGSHLFASTAGGEVAMLAGVDGTSSEDVTIESTGGTVNRLSIGQIGTNVANGINTVTLSANEVRLSGNIRTSDAAGNDVTIRGATVLDANIAINTNGAANDGDVTFAGTIDGAFSLTIDAGSDGDVTATGVVGGHTPLTAVTIDASNRTSLVGVVTTGAQSYTSDAGFLIRGDFRTTNSDVRFSAASAVADVTLVDDTLITTGSGAGQIQFGTDVDVNGTVEGRETLSLNAGLGDVTLQTVGISVPLASLRLLSANNASILSPAPGTTYLVADIAADAEATSVDNLFAVSFRNVTGVVTVNGSATGDDGFVLLGAKSNDQVQVTGTSVTANGQVFVLVNFSTDGRANTVTVQGFDGDDTITVTPALNLVVAVNGGNPSQGSDVLEFLTAVGPTTLHLGNATIDDTGIAGGVDVLYTGIETVRLNAGGLTPTIAASTGNDELTVSPLTADTGKIERGFAAQQSGQPAANTVAPVVLYSNLGAGNSVKLDLLAGQDRVTVLGDSSAQTFDVNEPAGSVRVDSAANGAGNDGFITYVNNEALALFGLDGADTFNLTLWTTAPIVGEQRIPVTVDGGTPIGIVPGAVDALNLFVNGAVTYAPGPEADAGGLLVADNASVSFDQIEAVSVVDNVGPPSMGVSVLGTNADDDITLQGVAANSYTVSVNAGPAVLFVGSNAVTLNGLSGDDDLDVDVQVPGLAVAISVLGGLPTASGGDLLTVTGVDGAAGDAPTFSPTDIDAGTLATAGVTITFDEVELVTYDGEADDETLTINGTASDDVFRYVPAATADAGAVQASTPGKSLVPLQFTNLGGAGIVNFAGVAGSDTLIQQGSNQKDVFTVAGGTGTIDYVSPSGLTAVLNHVDVTQTSVENLVLDTLDGDDVINLNGAPGVTPAALHPYSTITVQGGNPSASDTLNVNGTAAAEAVAVNLEPNTITGLGGVILYDGVEHVNLDVNAGGDTLTVNGTSLDDELNYTPTGANSGQFNLIGQNVSFAFTDLDGTFTMAGGTGESADQVNVHGTNSRDTITIDANTRVVQVVSLGVNSYKSVTLAATIDVVEVFGRNGQDTFIVVPLLGLLAQPGLDNLAINVDGGSPSVSDALVIASTIAGATLPAADFVVVSRGLEPAEGSIRVFQDQPGAGNNPFQLPDIHYADVEVVSPNVATTANGDPNLLILGADVNEPNEFRANSTFLGSGAVVQSLHASILPPAGEHPAVPGDQDHYRVVAEKTGILDFQVFFNQYSSELLPSGGDLSIEVRDSNGDLITTMFGGAPVGNNDASSLEDVGFVRAAERVRFPAVAGQTYYLRVFGRNSAAANDTYSATNTVLNGYDLQVINSEVPAPREMELNDIVQTGTVTVGTSATQFTATLAPVNGVLTPTSFDFVGKTVEFMSGPNVGRFATIASFNSNTGVFTVTNSLSGLIAAPSVGDTFLIETTDTGRSQLDNVTRDATPIVTFRLDDAIFLRDLPGNPTSDTPPDEVIPIPFNSATGAAPVAGGGYRVAIYDEGAPQQSGVAPQTPIGYARPLAGVDGVYVFDFGSDALGGSLTLSNGSHFLSARVELIDPATPNLFGYGPRSAAFEIVVDAVTPPISFGDPAVADDGLHPDSDSGDPSIPATLSDNATNDTTPTFFGRAEADSVVRLYIDRTNNGVTPDDLLLGQTVASPADGTNQHPFGEWQITSTINMNDPTLVATLGFDGIRNLYVTAEDVSGNISPVGTANTLQNFVDTAGPQVTSVFITSAPTYNLFSLKPGNVSQGPTPAVNSLTINVRDLPARQLGFLYQAISNVPPLAAVVLRGDHNGIIPIASITFTSDGNLNDNNPPVAPEPDPLQVGNPAFGYITLTFSSPLPDDRFTLTLHDNIIDPVGNKLDGENNAAEPVANPTFPTGDDIPGGDFIARFTVDSRPEIGTWSQGVVYVDINGNLTWDPEGQDNDYTNRDFIYNFGNITDAYFAGNFALAGAAKASGFDKVGSYGAWNGVYQFFLDTDDDGVQDFVSNMPASFQVNGIPVAGNFSAAHPGDEIGLFDGQNWYLDVNGNNVIDTNERFATTLRGLPLVGDFNGDGADDLATYNNDTGVFQFDLNRDFTTVEDRIVFSFSGFGERPVAGDVNLDGVDDIVMWVPGRDGQLPKDAGEFHFLVSDDSIAGVNPSSTKVRTVFLIEPGFNLASSEPAPAAFRPAPLGNDLIASFGDDFALPVIGNFDPPVADVSSSVGVGGSLTNPQNPLDVDGDGIVAPIDSLLVLNRLNQGPVDTTGPTIRTLAALNGWTLDTSGDGEVSPIDALLVINYLNALTGGGEGEGANVAAPASEGAAWADAVDAWFADELGSDAPASPTDTAAAVWSSACVKKNDEA